MTSDGSNAYCLLHWFVRHAVQAWLQHRGNRLYWKVRKIQSKYFRCCTIIGQLLIEWESRQMRSLSLSLFVLISKSEGEYARDKRRSARRLAR
jgi:hypothetical protein